MRRIAIAVFTLAVASACGGSRAERKETFTPVSNADFGRLNPDQMAPVDTARANLASARDALARLEMMIALSGAELPTAVARQYVASAIQILVHITRLSTGERKITRISEMCGYRNGAYAIEDIFAYRMTGIDHKSGRAMGAFYATGYEPMSLGRLAGAGVDAPSAIFQARELDMISHTPSHWSKP